MTKKHFIALADWIKNHNSIEPEKFTLSHLRTLSAFCETQNSGFLRGRWLDYIAGKCGKNGGKV
jgi:hypothetical protein